VPSAPEVARTASKSARRNAKLDCGSGGGGSVTSVPLRLIAALAQPETLALRHAISRKAPATLPAAAASSRMNQLVSEVKVNARRRPPRRSCCFLAAFLINTPRDPYQPTFGAV